MELRKISANRRSEHGKSSARRLRREGKIPAVSYGGTSSSVVLAVSPKDLVDVLHSPLGRNTVLELDIEGKEKRTVLLTDYQYHPLTRSLLHADFQQVNLDQPVDVDVPFELVGKAAGVVMGGVLRQVFRHLPVRCLPTLIPVKIVHDVTALEMDGHVAVRDLAMPEGVSVRLDPARTVAAVVAPEKEKTAEEEAAAAGVPAEGAAPAEGATPAEGAAPAEGAEKGKGKGKGKDKDD
jgi:large subunit ribosomal protein L25